MVQTMQDIFQPQTGIFRCAPCNAGAIAPILETGAMPWQRTKLPDTPYQLKPLKDSAPPPTPGASMDEIDRRIMSEATHDSEQQPGNSSPLLALTVLALCGACLYCKVSGPVAPTAVTEESIAAYQQRMREAKAANPGKEQRPAVRIPELNNRTREGQRP